MSLLVRFPASSVPAQQYDESLRRLKETEEVWPPEGLEYHVAFGPDDDVRVSEIWDSREQFEAFGERLMPLLSEMGITIAGEPEFFDVHNVIRR